MKQQVYEEALKRIRAEASERIDALNLAIPTIDPASLEGAVFAVEQGELAFRLLGEIVALADKALTE